MKKTTRIIISTLLISFMIAVLTLYIWELSSKGESDNLLTLVAVECSMVAALIRLNKGKGSRRPISLYEQSYAKQTLRAFESRPKEKKQLFSAARLYNEQKYDQALKLLLDLKRDCRSTYDKQAVMLFTALCYSDSGNDSAAIDTYEALLLENPEHSYASGNLGVLYMAQGKYTKAEALFRKVIEVEPNEALGYHNLASLYYRNGEYDRAIELSLKALEQQQNYYQSSSLLSILYALQGDMDKSQTYFEHAVSNGQNAQNLRFTIDRRLSEQNAVRKFAKELNGREQKFNGDIVITDPTYIVTSEEDWEACQYGENLDMLHIPTFITFEHGDCIGTTLVNTDTDEVLGEFASDSCMVSVMLLSEVEAYNAKAFETLSPSCFTIIRDFHGTIRAAAIPDDNDQYWKLMGEGNINFESTPD